MVELNADEMEFLYEHEHGPNNWIIVDCIMEEVRSVFLQCGVCKRKLVVLIDHDAIAKLNTWMDIKTAKYERDKKDING